MSKISLMLLVAMLAAPLVGAQSATGVAITMTDPAGPIPAGGSTSVDFTLHVGCALFAEEAAQSLDYDVSTSLPTYFGAGTKKVTASAGADCVTNSGIVSVNDSISISPAANATANSMADLKLTASGVGGPADVTSGQKVWVQYEPGHRTTPSITFPYTMTADDQGMVAFNVTIEILANSNTMVMFIDPQAGGGTLKGLSSQVFNIKTGDAPNRTLAVSWTPPAGEWTQANITYYTYSHCLDTGFPCLDGQFNAQNVTWSIMNGIEKASGNGDSKGSPGLPLVLVLAAIALLARRR